MRLIDAEALLEQAWDVDCRCGYVQVVDVGSIEEAPTIEAKPIVHAHWKDIGLETKHRFCTKCGGCVTQRESWVYKYCPCCGAQMDEKESD